MKTSFLLPLTLTSASVRRFLTRLAAILVLVGTGSAYATDWCTSASIPEPTPGLKVKGIKGFEIGPGKGNGSLDPPCPPAACLNLAVTLPDDATIEEAHVCAAEMNPKPLQFHECTKVMGETVWWDCHDNPPYARFFPDIQVQVEGQRKTAKLTFKTWSNNYPSCEILRDLSFSKRSTQEH
jgi:hypothetical protein